MAPYQYLDDLIREYLLFRGFSSTVKALDADVKAEKERAFRPDRIIDQMLLHISSYDLASLKDLWQHLHHKLFKRLDSVQNGAATRLESSVMKLYVVNCVQNKRSDKVREFFERMTPEVQNQPDWKDWFVLPFISSPETHPTFQSFFSRHWQDTLLLSLHNFLAIVFARLPPPRLAEFQTTSAKLKRLREENEVLRLALIKQHPAKDATQVRYPDVSLNRDLMDDFYIIAQHEQSAYGSSSATETQVKTIKNFLRTITGGASSSVSPTPSAGATQPAKLKVQVTPKPRSSSRSRPSSQADLVRMNHTPLKRVAQSVPMFLASESNLSFDAADSTSDGYGMAYLLLGQEEYLEHHSEVTQCKFSGSGYVIGSSDVDGVVKIWSASPGAPHTLATFISNWPVTALDWLCDSDRHFVYGTANGIVRLCDAEERKVLSEVAGDSGQAVHQVLCSPNNSSLVALATGAGDSGRILLYDVKASSVLDKDLAGSLSGMDLPLSPTCLFNHNSTVLISGGSDGKIRLFDLRQSECIASWSVAQQPAAICGLHLSSDETIVYVLNVAGDFSAWSLVQTSQKLLEARLEDVYFDSQSYPRIGWGRQFSFARDGKHMLACSTNGGNIYELVGQQVQKVLGLKGHKSHTTCTDWSASSDCGPCVTAGVDGHIRISTLLSQ